MARKPRSACIIKRMLTHAPRDASALSRHVRRVTAVGRVIALAVLVGTDVIGAKYVAVLFRDEGLSGPYPSNNAGRRSPSSRGVGRKSPRL